MEKQNILTEILVSGITFMGEISTNDRNQTSINDCTCEDSGGDCGDVVGGDNCDSCDEG